ncbi:MAG: DUF29 domain-containing protein [Thioploca sp.]|nr:DUF29 domain-containing protein [Thioploca sp.]
MYYLKPGLTDAATKIYSHAVKLAAKETKLHLAHFPSECPYSEAFNFCYALFAVPRRLSGYARLTRPT